MSGKSFAGTRSQVDSQGEKEKKTRRMQMFKKTRKILYIENTILRPTAEQEAKDKKKHEKGKVKKARYIYRLSTHHPVSLCLLVYLPAGLNVPFGRLVDN